MDSKSDTDADRQRMTEQYNTYKEMLEKAKRDDKEKDIFYGFDGHYFGKQDTSILPTPEQLKQMGIQMVIILKEIKYSGDITDNTFVSNDDLNVYYNRVVDTLTS